MGSGLKYGMGIADGAESYMDAPDAGVPLSAMMGGGGGSGAFMAQILDAVGIHKQVANTTGIQGKPLAKPGPDGLVQPEIKEGTGTNRVTSLTPESNPIDKALAGLWGEMAGGFKPA